ncbi:GNAT family N-acetyltransferase [Paracraurococcus lichenis]|uniref:N-acetyltransferase domain-containing protein n=1 Tax=Paracraurococcus lichenis TaxID=3064888 RepID=A0ABT9E5U4_9PROT|nr:hypothetical protein [Paracraurococcus sp. LOR1-02]MDO9711538.1 hypothetical protein [Paracraurococcus sp. LOR1-02]
MGLGRIPKYTFSNPSSGTPREVKEWNKRLESTKHILNHLEYYYSEEWEVFGYVVGGVPIGILAMENIEPNEGFGIKENCTMIHYLVTHPGSSAAGAILVEFAVNYSERSGLNGAVALHSLDGEATRFYRSLGFIEIKKGLTEDDPVMQLNPFKSAEWVKQDKNVWRLKRYVGQESYMGSRREMDAYRWQTKPPIFRIKNDFASREMLKNLEGWEL